MKIQGLVYKKARSFDLGLEKKQQYCITKKKLVKLKQL